VNHPFCSGINEKYDFFIDKELGGDIIFENKYSSEERKDKVDKIFSTEQYVFWQTNHHFRNLSREGDLEWVQVIGIPQIDDTVDPQNLLNFFQDMQKRTESLFDLYCKNNVPLAILSKNEGGLVNAIGHIQQENKGFINFSDGTIEELEKQKEVAGKIIEGVLPFYIDITSALFLSESEMLQKIYAYIPNLLVPQSVLSLLADIADKFRYTPGQTGSMGYAKGKIILSSVDEDKREFVRSILIASIKLFESTPKNIKDLSYANKMDCFFEREIPAEFTDASILAQKENLPVLTDDFLYLKFREMETKNETSSYFSSWALVRILFEKGSITFDEYLDYFGYLSSYRVRFLPIHANDIEIAVLGNGETQNIKPENIRRFNLQLTLSEDYGVPFQTAFRVVKIFLFRILMNNNVTIDLAKKIFVEIIEAFPTKLSKKELGQMLISSCVEVFEKNMPNEYSRLEDKLKHRKINQLLQTAKMFDAGSKLVISK
jgi:hypothetical protein